MFLIILSIWEHLIKVFLITYTRTRSNSSRHNMFLYSWSLKFSSNFTSSCCTTRSHLGHHLFLSTLITINVSKLTLFFKSKSKGKHVKTFSKVFTNSSVKFSKIPCLLFLTLFIQERHTKQFNSISKWSTNNIQNESQSCYWSKQHSLTC